MANTYNQIYVHFVFSVKNRENLISSSWENRLYQYIRTIINDRGNKLIIINGTANHVHMLVQLSNQESSSVLMRNVKQYSSKFIKNNGLCRNFAWQEGYGAFSYTKSHTDKVSKYIENQKEHHKKVTYAEEVRRVLANLGYGDVDIEVF